MNQENLTCSELNVRAGNEELEVNKTIKKTAVAVSDDTPTTTAGSEQSPSPFSPQEANCKESKESFPSDDAVRIQLNFEEAANEVLLQQLSEPERRYWEAFFVVLPVFCGYASLFGLQHEIKSKFGIKDNSSSASHDFGFAVSFLYIFNLIFRFAHNIVFGCMSPRYRVYVAMSSMMASMLTIGIGIMIFEICHIYLVILAYALGGVAIGCFEANFLSCLTPLGNATKHLAITAIPPGITTILVGAFLVMGPPLNVPSTAIYIATAIGIFFGMLLLATRIPDGVSQSGDAPVAKVGLKKLIADARAYRSWLPQLWHYPLAFTLDMFCLSCFSPGVALYIYDQKTVAMTSSFSMHTDSFFAVFNLFNMMGGLTGRWLSYRITPRHPVLYTIFSAVGVTMILLRIPLLAPLSTFLVMLGDGLIYGSISRHIDAKVPREFNLIAISFWLFIGDIGSVTGSNLISYIRDWVVGQ